ncbi:MAG: hypothetical protein ACQESR_27680 [Planctomycetota bacterium]
MADFKTLCQNVSGDASASEVWARQYTGKDTAVGGEVLSRPIEILTGTGENANLAIRADVRFRIT